ncbi:hypothetical protein TrispH2_006799 [Trichoplax sp. H2]|uniref:PSI domain-containing protein n=1 Tax=Trichoplax adhaerens TaxID=10228 RepID=B3S4Y4_TRIAD|nr:hypothetical protein TRIADDRAFT_59391 [Trichoplax adhaerens]EDV22290.1 hypothetical protein TRIADDRAFT_59391 [Trichoplax adhaerens]RDD42269.1 hypothetical protein TrispH2_006799 [Trichoplax sp. H2]|eukprot:XP_002115445.1 hypothetical protein TRIADDRAFT_59391 [Trichoplax adhaerens]
MEGFHLNQSILKLIIFMVLVISSLSLKSSAIDEQLNEGLDEKMMELTKKNSSVETGDDHVNCYLYNGNCHDCLRISYCFYCGQSQVCERYRHSNRQSLVNAREQCTKGSVYIYQCLISEATIIFIAMGSSVVLVVAIITCVGCYCIKRRQKLSLKRDNESLLFEFEKKKERQDRQRKYREEMRSTIRQKYGLTKDRRQSCKH